MFINPLPIINEVFESLSKHMELQIGKSDKYMSCTIFTVTDYRFTVSFL